MAELTLVSSSHHPLQSLVEGALQNELGLLEAGIQRSEQRLQEFEGRYGLSTALGLPHRPIGSVPAWSSWDSRC